ncbi:hypothetical protein B0O80DRAFT_497642 [Mortierella sp. GBAus27b]|nr:hypothetical protein B0O80DRAFT_497642 [Mortierella sp. GBAus27b]
MIITTEVQQQDSGSSASQHHDCRVQEKGQVDAQAPTPQAPHTRHVQSYTSKTSKSLIKKNTLIVDLMEQVWHTNSFLHMHTSSSHLMILTAEVQQQDSGSSASQHHDCRVQEKGQVDAQAPTVLQLVSVPQDVQAFSSPHRSAAILESPTDTRSAESMFYDLIFTFNIQGSVQRPKCTIEKTVDRMTP